MRSILIVAAERHELAGLQRRYGRPVRLQWPVEHSTEVLWNGKRWLLVANGAGSRLVTRAMEIVRERAEIDVVVSTGFCGGLDPVLAPGDLFVASLVVTSDWQTKYKAGVPVTAKTFRSGTLVSADRVVQTATEKRALHVLGAGAVDMEAATVARLAAEWRKPFYCIRAVTDSATEGFVCDLNACRNEGGGFVRWRILASALRHPLAGPAELLRLGRRSRQAAEAIGEFLDDCDF